VGLTAFTILGIVFAMAFVSFGFQRIDPEARGAGFVF
jgi:hypothetical protein